MNRQQLKKLEDDLWAAADKLRANSDLKASEYSTPVLGLIFLKFADLNYRRHEQDILREYEEQLGTRLEKPLHEIAIARCGFYLPTHARYDYLLDLPQEEDIAKAIEEAMESIEYYKKELAGSLPRTEYHRLTRNEASKDLPFELLRQFNDIPRDAEGDVFGQIYEYFLGKFALAEGQGGGEFFTPRSVVRLMVEIIEPHGGKVFDPACGSGGMFVQSASFIARHRDDLQAQGKETSVFVSGQEKSSETVKLARMNLAVNGLRGQIKQGISYYDDHFKSIGKFDYVLANPPFNVDDVLVQSVEDDARFNAYGIPRKKTKAKKGEEGKETVPNANYLWINLFATSLNEQGRAALVMANSASDARHSEADIRRKLIEANLISGMLTLPSNMFYTVTLPATLWFFDRAKDDERVLFIDARNIFTPIDRAHREFSEAQIQNIAMISRLHKGRRGEFVALIDAYFRDGLASLRDNRLGADEVIEELGEVLADAEVEIDALERAWDRLEDLELAVAEHRDVHPDNAPLDARNTAQHELRAVFEPFFVELHTALKAIDKAVRRQEKLHALNAQAEGKRVTADRRTNALKKVLEKLHAEVRDAELCFTHIRWLQERFPEACYEDVTGLCKLATQAEIEAQDWSLNPGRYVGVVIEEDGKTEEEFVEELIGMHKQLEAFAEHAATLQTLISANLAVIADES